MQVFVSLRLRHARSLRPNVGTVRVASRAGKAVQYVLAGQRSTLDLSVNIQLEQYSLT